MAPKFGTREMADLLGLCEQHGRIPIEWLDDGLGNLSPVFDPPLSAGEQTAFDDLSTMARLGLTDISLATFRSLRADFAIVRAWATDPNPTNAKAIAYTQAQARITVAQVKLDLLG